MPRGLPDYGNIQTETVNIEVGGGNTPPFDVGFARMDGGGRVVYFEDFRCGAGRYEMGKSGTGTTPYLVTTSSIGAGFYPKLLFKVAANTDYSYLRGRLNVPLSGKCGIEIGYWFDTLHPYLDVQFASVYSGGNAPGANFRIGTISAAMQIYTGGAYSTVFTPGDGSYVQSTNLSFKLVIDTENSLYDVLWFSGRRIALGQALQPNLTGGEPGRMFFEIKANCPGASYVGNTYINYILVTADEP